MKVKMRVQALAIEQVHYPEAAEVSRITLTALDKVEGLNALHMYVTLDPGLCAPWQLGDEVELDLQADLVVREDSAKPVKA
mgnify:CR=1